MNKMFTPIFVMFIGIINIGIINMVTTAPIYNVQLSKSQKVYEDIPGSNLVIASYDLLRDVRMQQIFEHTYEKNRIYCPHGTCYCVSDGYVYKPLFDQSTNGRTHTIYTSTEWEESYSETNTVVVDVPVGLFTSASAKYSEEYNEYKRVYTEYESVETDVEVKIDDHLMWIRPGLMKLRDDVLMDAGLFSSVSGSKSKEYEEFHSVTNEHQSATTNVYIGCDEYELIIRPRSLKFFENIYSDVFNLPDIFDENDEDNKQQFYNFFKKYGTVWPYKIVLDGRMNGNSFTEYAYMKTVDETTLTEQMTASFYAMITHQTEYSSKLTKEYNESSHHYEISTFGGGYFDPTDNDITTWTQTINLAPVMVYTEFYPIHELFSGNWVHDPELSKYYSVIKQAVESYLSIPSCVDLDAYNYNPDAVIDDGSCVFIHAYTNEYLITSKTLDPDTTSIRMINSDEGFCYLVYLEYCETRCRVEIGSDGFWYVRSGKICTASPDIYCGARCTYTIPVIGSLIDNMAIITTNDENNYQTSMIPINMMNSQYKIYLDYNPVQFVLPCKSSSRIDRLIHSSSGFCYISLDDYHYTQCQTRIDEDGYWYLSSFADTSGHNCSLDICNAFCASIKIDY